MRFRGVVLCLLALGGSVRAADDASTAPGNDPTTNASKLPKTSQEVSFVPSGVKRQLGFFASVNPDCSSFGDTTPRLLTKPEHGNVTFDYLNAYTFYPAGNSREHCNTEKVRGLAVMYASQADYVGEDSVEVLLLFPSTTAKVIRYTIVVR